MRPMFRRLSLTFALLLPLLLAACSSMSPKPKLDMRVEYGHAVRWSDWDMAWQFIDPATRTSAALPAEELDRRKDVKVSGYAVRDAAQQPDGTIKQRVEIHYVDQATQIEHVKRVDEVWRTDDEGEHWWLTTGLPEF